MTAARLVVIACLALGAALVSDPAGAKRLTFAPRDAADACLGHNPSGRGTAGTLLRRPRLPYSRYGCASPPRIASRSALVAHVC